MSLESLLSHSSSHTECNLSVTKVEVAASSSQTHK